MKIWSGYTIRLTRASPGGCSRSPWRVAVVACFALGAAALALVAAMARPASAANPASLNVTLSTVTQAVKSVTVSPAGINYTNCVYGSSDGFDLGFPNGACMVPNPGVTVTNGSTPATITVNGADMVPVDNGTHWALCGPVMGAPACTQGTLVPGTDQYYETLNAGGGYNSGPQQGSGPFLALSNTGECDSIFNPGCGQSGAGSQKSEFPAITGPQSSTDPSANWTTSIVWTAT